MLPLFGQDCLWQNGVTLLSNKIFYSSYVTFLVQELHFLDRNTLKSSRRVWINTIVLIVIFKLLCLYFSSICMTLTRVILIKICDNIIDGVYFVRCSIFLLLNLIYLKSKMLLNILFFIVSLEGLLFFNVVFLLRSGIGTNKWRVFRSRYSLKSGYLVFWRNLFCEVGTPRLVQVCNSYLQVQTCVPQYRRQAAVWGGRHAQWSTPQTTSLPIIWGSLITNLIGRD